MHRTSLSLAAVALACLTPAPLLAQSADDLPFDWQLDLRYRLEIVDQANLPDNAAASTLRIRGGLETEEWHGLSALVEGEAVFRLGPEDFNDTVNGFTQFPVVADPSDALLNRAFIRWRPHSSVEVVAGRQKVNFDNERWIGSVDWRQNDQTFDLAQVTVRPAEGAQLDYFHGWQVNRIFGPDSPQGIWRDTDIHNIHASYIIPSIGTASAYGYFLDIPDAPAANSQTLGLRLTGTQALGNDISLHYAAEYANQRDLDGNPSDFSLDYLLIEPGISVGGWMARAGYEQLEGDGRNALQTPLATLHAFNGWTDRFLVTPANGLRDVYADIGYRFGEGSVLQGLMLRGIVHDFGATATDQSYGRELNLLAMYPVTSNVTLLAKFAHYEADSFSVDTTKGWLQLQISF